MSASISRDLFWSVFIPVLATRRFAGPLCILPSVAAISTSNVACSIGEGRALARRKSASLLSGSMVGFWPHIRRWQRLGISVHSVIEWNDKPVQSVRKGFASAVRAAGLDNITPHTLRHTAVTWALQNGADPWETAGYLGMTVEMLDRVYGHHHPDHQANAAAAIGGRKLRRQDGDRTGVNKPRQTQTSATKIAVVSRGAK